MNDNFDLPETIKTLEPTETKQYLEKEWPVEEGKAVFSGATDKLVKKLEGSAKKKFFSKSLCIKVGGSYTEFTFLGYYENKLSRMQALRTTLGRIGFYEGSLRARGFFDQGSSLNKHEQKALLEGFKGKHFFYMAKLCLFRQHVGSTDQTGVDWDNKSMTQPTPVLSCNKAEKHDQKYTLFGQSFFLKSTAKVKAVIFETICRLQCGECTDHYAGLSSQTWSKDFNHARYRVAQHLLECNREEKFYLFCIWQLPPPKLNAKRPFVETEESNYKKQKNKAQVSRAAPITGEARGPLESKTESKETPMPLPESEAESKETPMPLQESKTEREAESEAEETVVEVTLPPSFTEEYRQRRRNAATGEELDDGEAHFLGFARFGAYAKDWEERHEIKAISYKTFLLVFFVSLALALVQLFLVPRMPQFQRWPKQFQWQPALQHLAAIVLALIIAYKATFVRAEPRRDLWLFCLTSALVLWVDTGCIVSLCVSPAICCYAASKIMLWHKKRSLAWVPFVFLMVYNALTYVSVMQQCLEILKLFLVVTSFVHEQRRGSAVATVLFGPYRDLLFVVEFPAVYLYEFLEELDLV